MRAYTVEGRICTGTFLQDSQTGNPRRAQLIHVFFTVYITDKFSGGNKDLKDEMNEKGGFKIPVPVTPELQKICRKIDFQLDFTAWSGYIECVKIQRKTGG